MPILHLYAIYALSTSVMMSGDEIVTWREGDSEGEGPREERRVGEESGSRRVGKSQWQGQKEKWQREKEKEKRQGLGEERTGEYR